MRIEQFLDDLASIKLPAVFNPYSERCEIHDKVDAPSLRQQNLKTFLAIVDSGVESLWIGRDLGYRDGRRTGLPLTDERHLDAFRHVYCSDKVAQATVGPPVGRLTPPQTVAGCQTHQRGRLQTPQHSGYPTRHGVVLLP